MGIQDQVLVATGLTATITNLYNARLSTLYPGGGTYAVTNHYGLYIGDVDKGSALNYAIYTGAGLVSFGDGVILGAPTGGNKGTGTLNAAGDIYKNNSAYTNPDYALEMWRDGRIVQFADNPGASTYRRLSLIEVKQHIVNNLRLPGFSDRPVGIFERGDLVLEKLEEIFTYLIDHEERLQNTEASLVF